MEHKENILLDVNMVANWHKQIFWNKYQFIPGYLLGIPNDCAMFGMNACILKCVV